VREAGGTVLLAVADGVGGGPGGEIAADAAVSELATRFFAAPASRPISERLGDAMREANTAVLRAADAESKPNMATTLVAAAVRGDQVVIGNLGDSRAYVVRDGESRQLTVDHSGAQAHGITRFVGDPRGVQADVFVERLLRSDRLVLCSDGLTRHVDPTEIAGALAPGAGSLAQAAEHLVALANARGGEDNVTVVLYASGGSRTGGNALAFGLFIALVVFVVAGALAVLGSLAPYAPAPTEVPAVSPTAGSSPTPPVTASPSPTP
jgi:serine/threonine protein phosphatase PrpC